MVDNFLSYITYEKRSSSHTITAYSSDLAQFKTFLEVESPNTKLNQISHIHIRAWIVALSDAKVSARSINRKIASLRAFYKFLLKRNFVTINPTSKIIALKTSKKLPRFVDQEDINIVFNDSFSSDFAGVRDKLIFELFYGTGMRLSELVNLKVSDLNLYEGQIKILGKRNKERIVPMNAAIANVVEDYLKLRNKLSDSVLLLLTDKYDPVYQRFVQRIIHKYLMRYTKSEKTNPHVLRHTFATHMLNKGADLNAIKDLLGHSSLAATQIYTHNSVEKLKTIFKQAHPKA